MKIFTDPWGSTLANHGGFEIDPATGEFVLWYSTRPLDPEGVTDARFICQARSGDGVHWETPPLGLFEFRGSRDNNICVVNYPYSGVYPGPHELSGPCIARDPLDPDPSARYKMALWRYNRDHDPETGKRLYESKDTPYPTGLYTSASPDGIHWPARERLVHTHADGFGDTYTWMLDSLCAAATASSASASTGTTAGPAARCAAASPAPGCGCATPAGAPTSPRGRPTCRSCPSTGTTGPGTRST